jgi:hypothetical protein
MRVHHYGETNVAGNPAYAKVQVIFVRGGVAVTLVSPAKAGEVQKSGQRGVIDAEYLYSIFIQHGWN